MELGEVEKPVFRLPRSRFALADCTVRFDESRRVKQPSTFFTLIAAGSLVATVGTLAFHETVRQITLTLFAVGQLGFLSEDVAILIELQHQVLYELPVHWVFRAGVVVEGYSPFLAQLNNLCMVPVGQLFWLQTLLDGCDFGGRSVFVGATDHDDIIALQPIVASSNVRGQQMNTRAQVRNVVYVGPSRGNEDFSDFNSTSNIS